MFIVFLMADLSLIQYHFFNNPPPPNTKKKEGVVSSFKIQFSICNKKNLCYGEKKVGASSSVHGLNFDTPPPPEK